MKSFPITKMLFINAEDFIKYEKVTGKKIISKHWLKFVFKLSGPGSPKMGLAEIQPVSALGWQSERGCVLHDLIYCVQRTDTQWTD